MSDSNWPSGSFPSRGDQSGSLDSSREFPSSSGLSSADVAPQKSHRRLRIVLIGCVLVLGLLGFYQYLAPPITLQRFCNALEAQDYVTAYSLFTNELQAQTPQDAFIFVSQAYDQQFGKVTACGEAPGNAYTYTLFGSTQMITAVIIRARSVYDRGAAAGQLHFVNENGWKISAVGISLQPFIPIGAEGLLNLWEHGQLGSARVAARRRLLPGHTSGT